MAPRRTGHSPLAQEVGDENVSIRSRGHARVRVRGPDPCPRLGGLGCRRHVYVNDNTTAVNTIGAFDRHADGTLTPMPGSPFEAGGFGSGKETVAQGALQLSSEGRYLLAVDDGSNQISVCGSSATVRSSRSLAARDRHRGRVHGEHVLTVVADLEPARRGLVVGER